MIYVKCISWPTGKKFYNWIYWPVYLWIHTPNWSTVSDRGHQPPGGGADLRHTSEVVGFRVVGGKSTTVAAFCGGFPLAIREMSEVVPQDFFCFGKKFFFLINGGKKTHFFLTPSDPDFFLNTLFSGWCFLLSGKKSLAAAPPRCESTTWPRRQRLGHKGPLVSEVNRDFFEGWREGM